MPRPRMRVCLQEGLSLNLATLMRRGFVRAGATTGPYFIRWSYTYTDEEIASGRISANLEGKHGWLRIQLGALDQQIWLKRTPRPYGGGQWYFRCPVTGGDCTVLWMPSGARKFASRKAWGRQVAYSSQFQTRCDRALTAAQRIRASLGGPDWAGIDETDPPKPKWMRWRTYERLIDRSRAYEEIADERLFLLIARWGGVG